MVRVSEPVKVSEAEWEVLRVIWTQELTTSQEVIKVLETTMDWKPATIKTLLGRLVKKELVGTQKQGNKYGYYPLVSEKETVQSATETLFSHICAKKIGQTLGDLIQQAELTKEDMAWIQHQLDQKQPVAEIACNCIPGQCECHKEEHDPTNEKRLSK